MRKKEEICGGFLFFFLPHSYRTFALVNQTQHV